MQSMQKELDEITSKTKAFGWTMDPPDPEAEVVDTNNEAGRLLVGKIFSTKPLNITGVREAIFKSWNFVQNLEVEEGIDHDIFIFSFPNAAIRRKVLDQCP